MTFSCQKQKSPNIENNEFRGSREMARLQACSNVNFNKGVLLYKNALDLFVCSRWDEQFPSMYQSMKKVSAASWDHVMGPLDESFISNQERRDRFFKNVHDLDSLGGLDDLSYVIVALNETNFFDSTKAMFICVDNPTDALCADRSGRIPEKKSLKNIVKIIDTDTETIENFSRFVKILVKVIGRHQEMVREEINKFRINPLFIPVRLKLIDSVADKVRTGLTVDDRELAGKLLLSESQSGSVPWIYQWIQDLKMSREKFRDLVEYPVLINPEFSNEIKSLKLAYDGGLTCSIKSNKNPNDLVEFDFKTHLADYVGVIRNRSYKGFYDYTSADILSLKMSAEVCEELEKNAYNSNFLKTLTHFAEFMSEKKYYELVKFLMLQTTAKGDLGKKFSENLYLFDLISGDFFSSANALNAHIVSNTRSFYPLIFDVLKALPADAYVNLGEFLQSIGKVENDEKFKGVAAFWNFFSPEEKNFIFNFIDRHFDKNVNYVLLFDFYTKFLDELKEVQPILKQNWMGSDQKEEMSYLALQDFFTNFAGKETLMDFKKFFSRDQIIKVLEVISDGQGIKKRAKEEMDYIYSDNYVLKSKSEKYRFKVSYDPTVDSDYSSREVIECMQKFNDIENGFYELVRHLPEACLKVNNSNIAFRLYGWINSIESHYLEYKKGYSLEDSLLDQKGFFSPLLINNTLGMTKVLDNLIGVYGANVPTKNGISYLLNSTNYYLNQKGGARVVDKNLDWLGHLMDIEPEMSAQHRNAIVKSFTRVDNFNYSRLFFNHFSQLFIDYGHWIKSGQWLKAQSRSLGKFDPTQTCEKVINQVIAPYPCPSTEIVKKYGNEIIFLFQNTWEKRQGSPIAQLLKAMKVGEGLDIPLYGSVTRKSRLSLRDTFKYLYDTSDKSWPVNNQKVRYLNTHWDSSIETITTAEGIEAAIREVKFRKNYMGAGFLNFVVQGKNYNEDVAGRKKITKFCFSIPGYRCGHKMSDNDKRNVNNALNVFDALLDVNNGRGLDPRLKYGDYLKTFEQILLASSPKAAQEIKLTPIDDDLLEKHNGKILVNMMMLTFPSNFGRVIRDRIGRTREDFESFINREDFKRVDRSLLYGFDLASTTVAAERLLNKLITIKDDKGQNVFENTVDWIASLSYDEVRLLEDTVSRLAVVGSYLGAPQIVFEQSGYENLTKRYGNNNLFQMFTVVEKLIDYWPTLKKYFPTDVKLIEVLRPVNSALYFLTLKLNSINDPNKNTTYLLLNDLFLALENILFDQLPGPQINGSVALKTQGVDFLYKMLQEPKMVEKTYSLIRADYKYLDHFHQNDGEWFLSVGQNLGRMAESSQLDFGPIRNYFEFTTKERIISHGESMGVDNYHYDEPANLIKFLLRKSVNGQSNFELANQKMFVENINQIMQMLEDLLPCLKIKEVKPPLVFN